MPQVVAIGQRLEDAAIITFPSQRHDLLSNAGLPGLGRLGPRKTVAVADEEVP